MLIEEEKLLYWINHFYGYGSWDSRFWFIGYEESGGDLPDEVADRINYLFKNQLSVSRGELCDIRDLYSHVSMEIDGPKSNLFSTRFDYRFGKDAVQHGVWKNLIAFQYGFNNKKLPDLLDYQKQQFGLTKTKQEALLLLYPLPSPHNHAWYYSWLELDKINFVKNRKLYEAHVYENRVSTILTNMAKYKPEVVLMYGMNNINALKKSVQDFYKGAKFVQVKMIKQQIPQHHWAIINGTLLIITTQIPALRHGRVESGFDWQLMGRMVKEYLE